LEEGLFRKVLPEPLKGHPEEPFFRNVSGTTTSSGNFPE